MPLRSLSKRVVTPVLTLVLAVALLPIEIAPAEAGRIKFRIRTKTISNWGRADDEVRIPSRRPFRIRFHSSSGSRSDSAEEENRKVRPPGAAAAAAARARAALEAEDAAREASAAANRYEPIPIGKTTNYSNGVTCVAGC
jgi:hypothetical protein